MRNVILNNHFDTLVPDSCQVRPDVHPLRVRHEHPREADPHQLLHGHG